MAFMIRSVLKSRTIIEGSGQCTNAATSATATGREVAEEGAKRCKTGLAVREKLLMTVQAADTLKRTKAFNKRNVAVASAWLLEMSWACSSGLRSCSSRRARSCCPKGP